MNSEKVRFALLGVTSFSGSWFCKFLIDKGYKVIGFGRRIDMNEIFLPFQWSKNRSNLELRKADINFDGDFIFNEMSNFQPTCLINFAAQGMVAESWERPSDWFQTNVLSQVTLFEKIRKINSIEKYIQFSTPEVYGSTRGWTKENYNFAPSTPYATSRASFDLHLKSFFEQLNYPIIFTRTSNVFGPGQQLYRILPRSIMAAMGFEKLSLHGGGKSERNFIDIRDVCKALFLICNDGQKGKTYHISGRNLLSIEKLVRKVAKLLKVDYKNICDIADERLGKDHSYALDSSFLRTSLGWSEDYSLEDTIMETSSWLTKNKQIVGKMSLNYEHRS